MNQGQAHIDQLRRSRQSLEKDDSHLTREIESLSVRQAEITQEIDYLNRRRAHVAADLKTVIADLDVAELEHSRRPRP